MKKALTLLLALLLTAVVAVTFVACGEKEDAGNGEVTYVSKYKSDAGFMDITADMVSWEGINSIPIKTANMDITEARKLCVDFFRYAKTALWIPDDTYEYYQGNSTDALRGFLMDIMFRGNWKSYAYVIPDIIREIENRGEKMDSHFLSAWQVFLSEDRG